MGRSRAPQAPKGLKRTLADYAKLAERSYPQVLREIFDRKVALLVVDPFAYENGGWSSFLLVALNEYAHFLRHVIGEIYQWEFRVKTFEQTLGHLERKAQERGYFGMNARPEGSVFP